MSSSEPDRGVDTARTESPAKPSGSVALEPSALRKQLPADLKTWRGPSGKDRSNEPAEAIWKLLDPFFAERGYTLWHHCYFFMTAGPQCGVVPNGYMHATPHRAFERYSGSIQGALSYEYRNALTRAARASDGRDVVFRVLAIGEEGREHVKLLEDFARGSYAIISSNHTLPLLELIELEDITFGVFPKVGRSCSELYNAWAESSVGDVLDMIAQCLEALVFLHACGVAHRDAFKDNFVIQWVPESLRLEYHSPSSRPRVYMIDFELAVCFSLDSPEEERVCIGRPSGGSLPGSSGRPMPPEVLSGKPYDPFKLDVWQLGKSISDFKSTIPEIDQVLVSMVDPNPATRPTAYEAMRALLDAISEIPPRALLIEPEVAPRKPVTLSDIPTAHVPMS
uniref:N/A n=1 Tax=Ganoderma boninense TaxID=34458 RepID=A0A5K1K2C3_9APHY|nr:N/A [Ganoderma boninense]